jgi:hypothetical protein
LALLRSISDPNRAGFTEEDLGTNFLILWSANYSNQNSMSRLFHCDRLGIDIQRPIAEQLIHCVGDRLGGHVIDLGF